MRITKSLLRMKKIRFQEFVKTIYSWNAIQLRQAVKNTVPNMIIYVGSDVCANCGTLRNEDGKYNCVCGVAERIMAESDRTPDECRKVLLKCFIEEEFPSSLVD